jgi:hypothetical protein
MKTTENGFVAKKPIFTIFQKKFKKNSRWALLKRMMRLRRRRSRRRRSAAACDLRFKQPHPPQNNCLLPLPEISFHVQRRVK